MGTARNKDDSIALQVLAPTQIATVSAENTDVSGWSAFCFPNDDVTIALNGAGTTIEIPSGTCIGIEETVTSITFSGDALPAVCLVM
jgi:hypothetical protein